MARPRNPDSPSVLHPNRCSVDDCPATWPKSYFDNMKAREAGWFFQRDGRTWCPEHAPDWVAEWRANQAKEQQ